MCESALYWGAMALVAYGAASALAHLTELVDRVRRSRRRLAYLVLVRNRADRVEGVVRALAREPDADLLLLDLGARDESGAILERLALQYEHAQLLQLGHLARSEAIATAVRATGAPLVVLVDLDRELEKEG